MNEPIDSSLPSPATLTEYTSKIVPHSLRLSEVWAALRVGTVRCAVSFCDETQCYMVLQPVGKRRGRGCLTARNLEILEQVLLGISQKEIALDLGLAPSTVAVTVSRCLNSMGLDCRLASVPVLVLLALHSAKSGAGDPQANMCWFEYGNQSLRIVWTRRPDAGPLEQLSDGELAVARLMVEGKTYAEIAALRRRSVRTVANQLASTYLKLGVSGRVPLVHQLVAKRAHRQPQAFRGILVGRPGMSAATSQRSGVPSSRRAPVSSPPPSSARSFLTLPH